MSWGRPTTGTTPRPTPHPPAPLHKHLDWGGIGGRVQWLDKTFSLCPEASCPGDHWDLRIHTHVKERAARDGAIVPVATEKELIEGPAPDAATYDDGLVQPWKKARELVNRHVLDGMSAQEIFDRGLVFHGSIICCIMFAGSFVFEALPSSHPHMVVWAGLRL